MSNPKNKIVDDDNHSWTTQVCGYVLTGNNSKRTLQAKLHRKKCNICKNINVKHCVEIPAEFLPLNKQSWIAYERGVNTRVGEFNIQKHYYLPKE